MKFAQPWMALAVCLFLALITWAVYGQTLGHEFVNFDDTVYVVANPHVVDGLTKADIAWAFTHIHSANWHPITWLSHMLDCQLYGLDPRGHHLSSVALHAATAIALFLVLWQMTTALWRSAFVAAVFAIHPLHVESVAWIAERKDVLSGLFFVLTLGAYLHYARRPWSLLRSAWVFILFLLGVMSKPMLVTAPVVLLLLDYWPLQRFAESRKRLLLEKIPLALVALASCAVTIFAQKIAIAPMAKTPLPERMANAVTSYVIYLGQMLWPFDLVAFYPFPVGGISVLSVVISLIVLLAISAAVVVLRRPYLLTGWLWYLVMLVPVIGIVHVGDQAHADRYTYLPQIGFYVAITWGVADLCRSWRFARPLLAAVSAFVLLALIIPARAQAAFWRNSQSLWRHALASAPDNATARRNYGQALFEKHQLNEALIEYQKSLDLDPAQPLVHSNIGVTLLEMGGREQAVAQFEKALQIDPQCAEAHSNLGILFLEAGQPNESLRHLEKAVEIDPNYPAARYNLGNTLLEMGEVHAAVAQYDQAIDLDPRDERALNNLAWILATSPERELRNGQKALELATRANSVTRGKSPIINATLAAAYAEAGRFADAIKTAHSAIELSLAENNLARAESIRAQLQQYLAGSAFRDLR